MFYNSITRCNNSIVRLWFIVLMFIPWYLLLCQTSITTTCSQRMLILDLEELILLQSWLTEISLGLRVLLDYLLNIRRIKRVICEHVSPYLIDRSQ
jgi:hypothetical protein